MDFAIRIDARDWFKEIRTDLDLDFDAFYFCFIAGVSTRPGRKKDVAASETATLVENFPGPYQSRGRLLVALFLSRELDYLGVSMTEKKPVHAAISRLVKPEAANFLSDEGVKEFNKYAHGGYELLLEWFDDKPRSLETFLRTFKKKIDVAMQSASSIS
jgi:hypothetical protein